MGRNAALQTGQILQAAGAVMDNPKPRTTRSREIPVAEYLPGAAAPAP